MPEQTPHVFVDVLDHSVEPRLCRLEPQISEVLCVFRRSDKRAVRCVRRDVGEERLVAFLDLLDPAERRREEQVRAEPLRFHERSVVTDHWIEILVARRIRATAGIGLTNSASTVNERFVESPLVRLIRLFIAQMPFSENAAGVTGLLKHLRQRGRVQRHALTLEDCVSHPVPHRMPTGHEC